MTLLADGEGALIERHEILCVNGVRYLIEPLQEVNVHVHLPLIRTASKCSRRNHL